MPVSTRLVAMTCLAMAMPALAAFAQSASAPPQGALPASSPLHQTIASLDRRLFDAFNSCDTGTMRELMEPGLEFYQDNDDSTFSRDQLELSQRLRCQGGTSRIIRELSTLAVYPLKNYGALQVGQHNFYPMQNGRKGELDSAPLYMHVWRNDQGKWTLSRVISYGH
jgi:hypothetical protein